MPGVYKPLIWARAEATLITTQSDEMAAIGATRDLPRVSFHRGVNGELLHILDAGADRITAVIGSVTVETVFWNITDARTVYRPASANMHDTLICPMKPDSTRSPMPDPQSN